MFCLIFVDFYQMIKNHIGLMTYYFTLNIFLNFESFNNLMMIIGHIVLKTFVFNLHYIMLIVIITLMV